MEIAVSKFRSNLSKLIADVRQTGKEIIITKRGRPIARLTRYPSDTCKRDPLIGTFLSAGRTVEDLTEPVSGDWKIG